MSRLTWDRGRGTLGSDRDPSVSGSPGPSSLRGGRIGPLSGRLVLLNSSHLGSPRQLPPVVSSDPRHRRIDT